MKGSGKDKGMVAWLKNKRNKTIRKGRKLINEEEKEGKG